MESRKGRYCGLQYEVVPLGELDVMTGMLNSANISNIAIIEMTEDHLESPHSIPDDLGVSGGIVFKFTGKKNLNVHEIF